MTNWKNESFWWTSSFSCIFLSFSNHTQSSLPVKLFYNVFLIQYHIFKILAFPKNYKNYQIFRKIENNPEQNTKSRWCYRSKHVISFFFLYFYILVLLKLLSICAKFQGYNYSFSYIKHEKGSFNLSQGQIRIENTKVGNKVTIIMKGKTKFSINE